MKTTLFNEAEKNKFISKLMLVFMIALAFAVPVVVYYLTDNIMVPIFLFFGAILYAIETWFFAISSAMHFVGAKKVTKVQDNLKIRQFINIVEEMKIASSYKGTIEKYVIEHPSINAMAVSRGNKAAVAITTGALEKLNREELSGVLGHELSHIANADTDVKLNAFITLGILAAYARMLFRWMQGSTYRDSRKKDGSMLLLIALVLAVVGYVVGILSFYAISRERESLADVESVRYNRNKEGLINALKKIKANERMEVPETSSALFFANPLNPIKSTLFGLFATHPPLDERIKRLEQL